VGFDEDVGVDGDGPLADHLPPVHRVGVLVGVCVGQSLEGVQGHPAPHPARHEEDGAGGGFEGAGGGLLWEGEGVFMYVWGKGTAEWGVGFGD
jgi:hypothetical protein